MEEQHIEQKEKRIEKKSGPGYMIDRSIVLNGCDSLMLVSLLADHL